MALGIGEARTRVDGSEWSDVLEPAALAGHRFRLAGPKHQVLVTSLTPADCFVRPSPGGVVAFLNWAVEGAASHEVAVDLRP